jgi:hypothetical protein
LTKRQLVPAWQVSQLCETPQLSTTGVWQSLQLGTTGVQQLPLVSQTLPALVHEDGHWHCPALLQVSTPGQFGPQLKSAPQLLAAVPHIRPEHAEAWVTQQVFAAEQAGQAPPPLQQTLMVGVVPGTHSMPVVQSPEPPHFDPAPHFEQTLPPQSTSDS